MKSRGLVIALSLFFLPLGCATEEVQRGLPVTTQVGIGTDIAVMDGALISQEMENPTPANSLQSQDEMLIVQCPACNQRVDVTGLPKERIRCPNCNSLFTY